jgi:hypothetical protein
VHSFVAARDKANQSFPEAPALRWFQVENLPHEISVQNPETVLAFVSLIALAIYLRQPRWKPFEHVALLTLNFLPLIFFFSRYIPDYPAAYWERLLAGGPEQRRVAEKVNPDHFRLLEKAPSLFDMLFPNDMGHVQRVHTVHGYSALQPLSLYNWHPPGGSPPQPVADFSYSSEERGTPTGDFVRLSDDKNSRIHCEPRPVTITAETMNTLTVSIGPGAADQLVRTDTFYPGWRAKLNEQPIPLEHGGSPFSTINLPADNAPSIVSYTYRPSHLVATTCLAITAGLVAIGISLIKLTKIADLPEGS